VLRQLGGGPLRVVGRCLQSLADQLVQRSPSAAGIPEYAIS